jgi:hypothetical protein
LSESKDIRLTDFRLAGFLVARGTKFQGTDINDRQEVVFIFNNEENVAQNSLNEYPGSPEQRYDAACKTMHDFVKVASQANKKRR